MEHVCKASVSFSAKVNLTKGAQLTEGLDPAKLKEALAYMERFSDGNSDGSSNGASLSLAWSAYD